MMTDSAPSSSMMTDSAAARKRNRDDDSAEANDHSSYRAKNPRFLLQNQTEPKENGSDVSTELMLSYVYRVTKEKFIAKRKEEKRAATRMGISMELRLCEDPSSFEKNILKNDIDHLTRFLISRDIGDHSVSYKAKMKQEEDGSLHSTMMTDPAAACKRNGEVVSAEKSAISSYRTQNPGILLQNEAETKENGFDVSTKLKLYYDSWVIGKEPFRNQAEFFSTYDSQNIKNFVVNREEEEIAAARMGISLELKLYEDPWVFKKKLLKSDIDNLARLLISRKIVENHIFSYWPKEEQTQVNEGHGVRVVVRDLNTSTNHKLTFKRWTSSNSYILIDNWSKDFVRRRNLKKGDEIGLFWNRIDSIFCFAVLNTYRKDQSL